MRDRGVDIQQKLCDIQAVSETLSIRLPVEDKRALFDVAAKRGESVNEFVRKAISVRMEVASKPAASPIARFFGSVDVEVPAPTNANVRREIRRRIG